MIDRANDDEWFRLMLGAQTFTAPALVLQVPAMFPMIQIYNPVGSGVRVRVRGVEPFALFGIAINHNLWRYDFALTTLNTYGISVNNLGDGPAPKAEIRVDNVAALPATGRFWLFLSVGSTRKEYPPLALEDGVSLLPGQSLLSTGIPGGFVYLGYQWSEHPIKAA